MALPGVTTILKDRFYALTRSNVPDGPRVLAIATRDTDDLTEDTQGVAVPTYDPYVPHSEEDVIAAFGDGSGCHRAFIEMLAGGAPRISLVAIPSGTLAADLVPADGVNEVLDKAFDAAESFRPDIIACWGRGGHPSDWGQDATPETFLELGMVADNSSAAGSSLAKYVADKCQIISERSKPVFAVMGVTPKYVDGVEDTENIVTGDLADHFAALTDNTTLADREALAFGDNGSYLSVVATEINVQTYPKHPTNPSLAGEFGYANGACTYAGFLSSLKPESAATGKKAFNVSGMRYNPTRPQQQLLIDKGLVPVALDFNRKPTWVDGLTFGRTTSDYTRLSTMRVVFDVLEGVRQVAQDFVGEPFTLQSQNALDTKIRSMLRGMQTAGALLHSDFTVTAFPRENKAVIDLVVRPAFELRNIEVTISVDL